MSRGKPAALITAPGGVNRSDIRHGLYGMLWLSMLRRLGLSVRLPLGTVLQLFARRGISLSLVAEVFDWRRRP
jgi:hypothetical protein